MSNQFDRMTKAKAQQMAKRFIADSGMALGPCVVCGDPESEGHHPDYNKPLQITALCRKHHSEIHRTMTVIPPFDKYIEGSINLKAMMDNIEKRALMFALHETEGNQTKAALYLGISTRSIRYKIDYHRITAHNP
jgi:DNA-binding NtrC family response regulator